MKKEEKCLTSDAIHFHVNDGREEPNELLFSSYFSLFLSLWEKQGIVKEGERKKKTEKVNWEKGQTDDGD